MKTFVLTTLLLGMSLFLGLVHAEDKTSRDKERQNNWALEGQWNIVYAEKDGKALDEKDVKDVTIQNQVLSYKQDGKERTWRFTLLPGHRFSAFEPTQPAQAREAKPEQPGQPIAVQAVRQGVFIASPDYLCIALDKMPRGREGRPTAPGAPGIQPAPGTTLPVAPALEAANKAPFGSDFVLILKRSGEHKKESEPRK